MFLLILQQPKILYKRSPGYKSKLYYEYPNLINVNESPDFGRK